MVVSCVGGFVWPLREVFTPVCARSSAGLLRARFGKGAVA